MIRLCLLLLFLLCNFLSADDKRTKEIALISASTIYDLDINRLPKVLTPYLKHNKDLKALYIVDNISNKTVFSFRKNKKEFIFNSKIPSSVKQLNSYESEIIYDGEVLGKVVTFWASSLSKIQYTKDEQSWLTNNPIHRVAVMNYWPHDDAENSLHTEVLKLINKYAGTNLIPIKFNAWSDGFIKASLGDELSGIMGLSWSAERENNYFHYTPAYDYTPSYLVTRKENTSIKSLSDLKNRTVYIKENSITEKLVKNISPSIKIIKKKTIEDAYKLLSANKETDAIVAYFIDEHKLDQYNLKVVEKIDEKYGEVSIGIHHKYPHLASIINKAFKIIPKVEFSTLREKKWENRIKHKNLILSVREKIWVDKHEPVKYAYDPDWKPFEWMDDLQNHTGIVSDLLKLIEEKSSIDFVAVNSNTWTQAIDKVVSKEAAMFSGVGETKKRLKYLNFTDHTLYSTPYVLVSREGEDYLDGLNNISNKKIGILKNSAIQGRLKESRLHLKLTPLETVKNGFDQLDENKIDIFIVNATTARYYINVMGYKKLKIAFKTKYNLDLKIAIRKDMPSEILSIIDKSIKSISEKEISDILHKWTEVNIQKETDWVLISKISMGILILLIIIILNNRKLKSMVEKKTSELSKQKIQLEYLVNSFDKNVIASRTDTMGNITYASEAFCRISGYTQEELLGQLHSIMRHPNMPVALFEDMWKTIESGKTWTGEIENLKKDKSSYLTQAIISPIFDENNKIIEYSSIREDITSKKEVEELSASLENKVLEKTRDLNIQLETITLSEITQAELLEEVNKTKKEVELILENILLPVIITSQENRTILYANKYAEIQYEMSLDEIIGSHIDDLYSVQNQQDHIIELLKTQGYVENLEEDFKSATGKKFTALLSVTPITYKNEKSYIGMITDITKQKAIEEEVRKIHKHTRESIEYASLIQGALIPNDELFRDYFKDHFVIWQPKDIVGGDIYLFDQLRHEDECLVMVIDCTGHGVPGAFVTMIVKAVEREIISKIMSDKDIEVSPAWIMAYFNRTLKKLLNQENKSSISNAGWDGQIFYYNKKEKVAKFSSARNSLFYMQEDVLHEIKGNRHSVGYKDSKSDYEFSEYSVDIDKETTFYISSDGYWDQIGGEKKLSFGKKRLKKLLYEIHNKSMEDQKEELLITLKEYQGSCDTNDDITVIGLKL